ncbi:MAG TPA: hypothetical protein VNR87_13525 [Flavisolibacter sp.]|nr:hypothetical protein [Flavisolibacter sp.]
MSEQIHVLAQQLLGKPSVDDCDLQEIKNLVQEYPYFAPAQFLLLEKLKREGSPEYPAQLQKAVLYYHNPLEFEYFLSSDKFYADADVEIPASEEPEPEPVVADPAGERAMEFVGQPANVAVDAVNADIDNERKELNDQAASAPSDILIPIDTASIPFDTAVPAVLQAVQSSEQKEEPLAFEPFHTVDYFASQGIKLVQEEVPKDRFGKQLKSFTEWLKTMKRLPVQEAARNVDPSNESNVQHLADDSIHESEVVTEAMAEVWLKQGNRNKALEVYNKLSLLNPSKNAYFAAKIEDLKRS